MSSFAIKIAALSSLIFSSNCPSCRRNNVDDFSGIGVCKSCEIFLKCEVREVTRGSLKVFTGSKYSIPMSHLILAAKEDNQIQARKYLVLCLARSLNFAVTKLSGDEKSQGSKIILIPIPSRKAADRVRGLAHVELLVKLLVRESNEYDIKILNCLQHAKKISDQSTLNFNERELNMRGAFIINRRFNNEIVQLRADQTGTSHPRITKTLLFLVDDLVTTGTTIQAANMALNHRGLRVDGTLASCATNGFTH